MVTITRYAVYWEGDQQADFPTRAEARQYVEKDIAGMAEAYGKTKKWVRQHFRWEIEKVTYNK